jgi:hypothetical protein
MKIPALPTLQQLDDYRRAKLGSLYGKFWVAPGVRWPNEFNAEGVWEPLPPKKPAESVRFACEEERLKKASGMGFAVPRRFEHVGNPMASVATASDYRNSDSSARGKWPRDLRPWFEACDLPDHLIRTMLVLLRPKRSGLQLHTSKVRLAIELGVCRRTAQRRVKRLKDLKVLVEIGEANKYFKNRPHDFRPSFTYQANPDAVAPRPTWQDFEKMRPTHRRLKVKSATQHHRRVVAISSPPVQEAASAATSPFPRPADAAPVAGSPAPRKTLGRAPRRLTSREGPALVAKMAELMRGYTRHKQLDGYAFNLEPDDPRYRAPLSQAKALIAACMTLGITEDDAREHLKLCCWQFEEAEPSP